MSSTSAAHRPAGPPLHRLVALLVALLLGLAAVVTRLTLLQVRQAAEFRDLGLDQRVRTVSLPAPRGKILDRSGQPLALSLAARDVYADPRYVLDPRGTAEAIGPLLGVRPREVLPALVDDPADPGDDTFAFVARQVDLRVAARIESLGLPGIGFLETSRRYYPAGELAAQVLGFVGVDGVGLAGLEAEYQDLLAGSPGELTQEIGPQGQPIPQGVRALRPPVPGADLVTTIDRELQYQAEAALEEAVRANRARGGTVIVMDRTTGDVLVMASFPSFDPNRFEEADPERWRNRAVTDAVEPGSVNKVITAGAAIEEGAVSLDRRFLVPWQLRVGGFVLHDAHPHPPQRMTLAEIVAESSNIGAVHVAEEVGAERLAEYLERFGLGRPTGLGFPGEAAGLVLPLSEWSATSLATMAYGQGISVTPLQMASVYATIANGGRWVQPRLVRGTVDASGRLEEAPASPTRRVIARATADTLTRILVYAVEEGTGGLARIPGYQVAGKTGTARKAYQDRPGYSRRYVASFVGFLPAGDPRVVVLALLDEPATVYGGVAAAPLFQRVARAAIARLGIAPAPPVPPPVGARPGR